MGNIRIKVYLNLKSYSKKERIKVRDIKNQFRTSNIFQIRIPQKGIIETAEEIIKKGKHFPKLKKDVSI